MRSQVIERLPRQCQMIQDADLPPLANSVEPESTSQAL